MSGIKNARGAFPYNSEFCIKSKVLKYARITSTFSNGKEIVMTATIRTRRANKWSPHKVVSKHEKQLKRLGFKRWHRSECVVTSLPLPCFRVNLLVATACGAVYRTYARDEHRRDWYIGEKVDLKPLGFVELIRSTAPVDIETLNYKLEHPRAIVYI
jgi:hypothetical protein